MPFYIELPRDRLGNRGFTQGQAQVIEAKPDNEEPHSLHVLAPDDIRIKWPTIHIRFVVGVNGPTRTLTEKEYVSLLEETDAPYEAKQAARKRLKRWNFFEGQ